MTLSLKRALTISVNSVERQVFFFPGTHMSCATYHKLPKALLIQVNVTVRESFEP